MLVTEKNVNLIFRFVHKKYKRKINEEKQVFWRATKWINIEVLPFSEFTQLLTLAKLESGEKPHKTKNYEN